MFYSPFQGSQDFTHCAATSDAVAFFFFHRIGARERMGTKASHLLSKRKEGREGALKLGHRWENMNILAKKTKQKGTEPLPNGSVTSGNLESWGSSFPRALGAREGCDGGGMGWEAEICAQHCLGCAFPCRLGGVGVSGSWAPWLKSAWLGQILWLCAAGELRLVAQARAEGLGWKCYGLSCSLSMLFCCLPTTRRGGAW